MRDIPRILIESTMIDGRYGGHIIRESSAYKPPLHQVAAVNLPASEGFLGSDDDATMRWNGLDFDEVDVDDD
jgi:hypothetical protein